MNNKYIFLGLIFVAVIVFGTYLILNYTSPETVQLPKESIEKSIIVLNNEQLRKGDTLKANFTPTAEKEIYIIVDCFTPTGWKLFKQDISQQWISTLPWYRDVSICAAECENNLIGSAYCDGLCPPDALGCKQLTTDKMYYSSFEWNQKFYEYKEGTCGNRRGRFIFINPASSGQYKLQYQYFEDSECKIPKFAEKIFIIK